MNIATAFSIGIISGYAVIAIVIAILAIYLAFVRPDQLFLMFAAILVFFNSQTSGAIGADANTIYYRGSGLLYLPIVTWLIIGGFLSSMGLGWLFHKKATLSTPLSKLYWSILALCLAHLIFGTIIGIPPQRLFSNNGLFPLTLSSMVFLWGAAQLKDPQQAVTLFKFLLAAVFIRCLFGLVRYAFLGGDPVNIYQNIEKLGIKVVFFDFHDSTFATLLVLFALSYMLIVKSKQLTIQLFCISAVLIGTATVILSLHRASLVGFFLGALVIVGFVEQRQKFLLLAGIGIGSFASLAAITFFRLSKLQSNTGVSAFFYDFVARTAFGPKSARALESKQALATIIENPLFGVGSWGRYEGFGIGWQELAGEGAYETVHNGFLQIALKSGVIGLALICILFFVHSRACMNLIRQSSGWYRCAQLAAFGAFISMMPNFAIGMVMAQQRGLFLNALLLLLPYLLRLAQTHVMTAGVSPDSGSGTVKPKYGQIPRGLRQVPSLVRRA